MIFKVTEPVILKENPRNVYSIIVYFDDGKTIKLNMNDEEELSMLINMYNTYMKNLEKDWNSYCNVEWDDVISYMVEVGFDEDYADIRYNDYWSYDLYSEFMAMLSSYKLTYFDENGIEYHVEICN